MNNPGLNKDTEKILKSMPNGYLKSLNYVQQKAVYDVLIDDCRCGHYKHGPACDHCECRRFLS